MNLVVAQGFGQCLHQYRRVTSFSEGGVLSSNNLLAETEKSCEIAGRGMSL